MEILHIITKYIIAPILNSEITVFFFKNFLNFLESIGYIPFLFTKLFVTTFPALYHSENVYASFIISTEIIQSFVLILLNVFFFIKYSLLYNNNHLNFFYKKFNKLDFLTKIRFILFNVFFVIPTHVLFSKPAFSTILALIVTIVYIFLFFYDPIILFIIPVYINFLIEALIFFYFYKRTKHLKKIINHFIFGNDSKFRRSYMRLFFYNPLQKCLYI